MKKNRFIAFGILLVLLIVGEALALKFGLYYILPWFDIVMHFLGGMALGVLSLWILDRWEPTGKRSWHILFAGATVGLLGGFLVEVIEYNLQEITGGFFQMGTTDTLIDLLADLLGGAFAAWAMVRLFHFKEEQEKVAPSSLPEVYHQEIPSSLPETPNTHQ